MTWQQALNSLTHTPDPGDPLDHMDHVDRCSACQLRSTLNLIQARVEDYRDEVDWCVVCTGHSHRDDCPFYEGEDDDEQPLD